MAEHVTDEGILKRIERLVDEEQKLYGKQDVNDSEQVRLEKLQVELDQCWDLLRQRRALREFGKDPDRATVRPASIVEKYEQ
jgi:Protein of unknown function (DUF2630)